MSQFPGLEPILAPQLELTINEEDRTMQFLSMHSGLPQMTAQERFSRNEWGVLIPILSAYPGYAAYAVLVAALTDIPRVQVQNRLEEARRMNILRQELRAVRDAVSHANEKLATFGFTLAPIRELGYTLALLQENT